MQFQVTVVTDLQTHTHKLTNSQTGPITIHCTAKLSMQCNKIVIIIIDISLSFII